MFLPANSPEREALRGCKKYHVRYYDSLLQPSSSALAAASRVLVYLSHYLGVTMTMPEVRSNACLFQADAVSCGAWVAFFAETEVRKFRGEGSWRIRPDLKGAILYSFHIIAFGCQILLINNLC